MPMIDADTEQRLRALVDTVRNGGHSRNPRCPMRSAACECGHEANIDYLIEWSPALLDTIAELRRAEAEAYERAAKVCDEIGATYPRGDVVDASRRVAAQDCAMAVRALTKQQDTDPTPNDDSRRLT